MKRFFCILVLLFAVGTLAYAWSPRFSYGLEWGYTGTFLRTRQYSYIYSAGSRITENYPEWRYFSNGSVLANAGLDISDSFNLSAYSGLLGVYFRRWMIPVELRARWCPLGLQNDGPLIHCGAAATFPTSTLMETSGRLNAGGGWRCNVYRSISIDFLLSLNVTLDHDIIYDPDTYLPVPSMNVTRNFSEYWGINFSLAVNF